LEVMSLRLSDGLLLQVGQTDDDRRELLGRLRRIVLRTMVLVILASLLGGYFLARRAMRPVRDLIATIKKIEGGAVGERVPVGRSGDEFAELARLFNGMLSRIETLIAGMRGALDNVAHDLRTPLTRLRAGAEHALASSAGLDASREALADCVEESDRVVGMVETLMDISEAETGLLKLKLEVVDLAVVAEEAVELYQDTAEAKGVSISLSAPAPVPVSADRNRLRQVAANLLDNAVKYAPRGGKIRVEAFLRGSDAVLIVSDDGPGIPAAEIPKVWDRLYRGDASRSQRGLGLGLSVVKAVVLAHRGKVDVESQVGRGARFSCVLPAGPAAKAV
jgi:signal transduction histidine kinase